MLTTQTNISLNVNRLEQSVCGLETVQLRSGIDIAEAQALKNKIEIQTRKIIST